MQQVISINRKKFATGLVWQPIASGLVARNFAGKLRENIDKKLNLYCEYRAMVGLGSSKSGHSVGIPSAAAEAVEFFSEFSSFLGVFKADNGFWLLAVRNGIILKDYLFEDENTARSEYEKMDEIPDWGSLFAPESWAMPRALDKKLEEVITGNVKVILKPISRIKADLISLVLLIIFILAFAEFFKEPIGKMFSPKPHISKIDPVLAAQYKKQMAEKKQELDKKYNVKKDIKPIEPIIMPYEMLPDPAARAKLCYQAIAFLMQPVNGWNQENAKCRETFAEVNFRRDYGNLDDFYEIATSNMRGSEIQEKSNSEIYVKTTLPLLPAQPSLEEKDTGTITRQVNSVFQKINTSVDINSVIDTVSNGTQSININVVEISTESKLTPPEFIKIFQDFSGVYMNLAEWNSESRTWNYEVIIYAK